MKGRDRKRAGWRHGLAVVSLLCLSGCGSIGGMFGGTKAPEAQPQAMSVDPAKANDPAYATAGSNPATLQTTGRTAIDFDPATECPQVQVIPGTSYFASYDGAPAPGSVRYQLSIDDYARECTLIPGNQVQIKIGLEGQALLGARGTPGSVSAPVRVAIRDRSGTVISSRILTASATIPPGGAQAGFRLVDQGASVPISAEKPLKSYEILVGFDEKGTLGQTGERPDGKRPGAKPRLRPAPAG